MIPILYDKTETTFSSNGLGRLADCTRCIVTEERNGIYECEFDYPITGERYVDIQEGQIIAATHDDNGDIQPFDIYHRSAPMDGIVTFYARHISYRQNGITVKPFKTTTNIADALAALKTNSIGTNPFTYWTDRTTTGEYEIKVPGALKALLGGTENSLLDVFGAGEYEYDLFTTKLWTRRGSDTDVEIRYRKNLSDITNDVDYGESYNGVVPYWLGTVHDEATDTDVETLVTLSEWAIYASGTTYDGRNTVLPLDLSSEFEEAPTEAELRTLATTKLTEADTLTAINNIQVSFVQLWQTEEYADVAPLQRVGLCDTVNVIFPELGVNKIKVKVIKVVYNTLLDRYDEMELGDSLSTYAAIVTANNTSKIAQLEDGLLIVSNAAAQAQEDAETARRAATSAQADAGDALIAAQNAATEAGNATTAAQNAQSSADAAQASADAASLQSATANAYANSALDQLGIVQDVVGVLDLLSTNANYQPTADNEVVPGKWYFTRSGYPGGSYSGDVVTFETTAGNNIDSLTVDLEPIQSLNGYDKPWAGGAGKNKADISSAEVGTAWNGASNSARARLIIPCKASTTYTLSVNGTNNLDGINGAYSSSIPASAITIALSGTSVTFTTASDSAYITVGFNKSGITQNDLDALKLQVEEGSAKTAYEPYENICPISGTSEVKTVRTNENLAGDYLTCQINGSGVVSSDNFKSTIFKVKSGQKYTVKGSETWAKVYAFFDHYPSVGSVTYNKSRVMFDNTQTATFTAPIDGWCIFRCGVSVGVYEDIVSVTQGETATDKAEATTAYTTDLGRTVYGGALDVTSGVLTVDKAIVTFNGASGEQWEYYPVAQGNLFRHTQSDRDGGPLINKNVLCNRFEVVDNAVRANGTLSSPNNGGLYYFDFIYNDCSSLAEWRTWLASNNVQVVYPLAQPQTYQLTPQQISTLLGVNVVWANSGTVNVVLKETYAYSVVNNPTGDPNALGYYEMTDIDAAVQSYVTSRLAVTSDGLWIQDPNMTTKILLSATDGVVLYGPSGTVIGKYGSTAQIGDAASFHIEMDGTELGFYQADRKVAYVSNQQLYITQSVVLQQMDLGTKVSDGGLGQWSWKVHANGANPKRNNLNLKWIG